jgi:DnaJ-class molecular chaperone
MRVEIECPDCFGLGVIEGNKGREITCSTCKGKGKVYEEANYENDEEAKITDAFDFKEDGQ